MLSPWHPKHFFNGLLEGGGFLFASGSRFAGGDGQAFVDGHGIAVVAGEVWDLDTLFVPEPGALPVAPPAARHRLPGSAPALAATSPMRENGTATFTVSATLGDLVLLFAAGSVVPVWSVERGGFLDSSTRALACARSRWAVSLPPAHSS
ncbi:MAG: hypothetical protein GY711_15145 [bacterium]|nr:hypothetical protein [bacterium]